ncbi:hypothetical protein SAMN05421805_10155 [Saccharopolyspora antimicrobica]|uniref:Uncharacterized protein n=1 Tax=Saccharopolyspora antimicrobica TaxID=455193 RepID=A0A1I4QBP6_9PSEU|nr:hypothetical protein [Saccharopolyspora antimicrobica]RKT84862.1 hypothetical protein ATL45_3193 [Saccharopolyspora antimicrobica]SFM37469.1 hypothetical protein SAMN05421805_10155 [Saccharopolyspora antimicrobica]
MVRLLEDLLWWVGYLAVVLLAFVLVLAWRALLPGMAIGAVAIATGLVRTVALGWFLGGAGLRAVMVGLERLGELVPAPRLRAEVTGR